MATLAAFLKKSALREAVSKGDVKSLKDLLKDTELDINSMDPDSHRTALHLAVENNQIECQCILLKAGADATIRDNSGNTALDMAVKNNKKKAVRAFNIWNEIQSSKKKVNQLVLNVGSDPSSIQGEDLLLKISEELELRAWLDESIPFGNSQNMMQVQSFARELGNIYSNQPNNHTYENLSPEEALFKACLNYDIDKIYDLIEKQKVDINVQDKVTGKTVLHIAVENGFLTVVSILLDLKADPSIKDKQNKTVLDVVEETGNMNMQILFNPSDESIDDVSDEHYTDKKTRQEAKDQNESAPQPENQNKLNSQGADKLQEIAKKFADIFNEIENLCKSSEEAFYQKMQGYIKVTARKAGHFHLTHQLSYSEGVSEKFMVEYDKAFYKIKCFFGALDLIIKYSEGEQTFITVTKILAECLKYKSQAESILLNMHNHFYQQNMPAHLAAIFLAQIKEDKVLIVRFVLDIISKILKILSQKVPKVHPEYQLSFPRYIKFIENNFIDGKLDKLAWNSSFLYTTCLQHKILKNKDYPKPSELLQKFNKLPDTSFNEVEVYFNEILQKIMDLCQTYKDNIELMVAYPIVKKTDKTHTSEELLRLLLPVPNLKLTDVPALKDLETPKDTAENFMVSMSHCALSALIENEKRRKPSYASPYNLFYLFSAGERMLKQWETILICMRTQVIKQIKENAEKARKLYRAKQSTDSKDNVESFEQCKMAERAYQKKLEQKKREERKKEIENVERLQKEVKAKSDADLQLKAEKELLIKKIFATFDPKRDQKFIVTILGILKNEIKNMKKTEFINLLTKLQFEGLENISKSKCSATNNKILLKLDKYTMTVHFLHHTDRDDYMDPANLDTLKNILQDIGLTPDNLNEKVIQYGISDASLDLKDSADAQCFLPSGGPLALAAMGDNQKRSGPKEGGVKKNKRKKKK